jgi:hypothetical protein
MPLEIHFNASLETFSKDNPKKNKPMLVVFDRATEEVAFDTAFGPWLKSQCEIWANIADNLANSEDIQSATKLLRILKKSAKILEKALEPANPDGE